TCIGKRRVEYRNTALMCRLKRNLICANAETTDPKQAVCRFEYGLGDLSLTAQTNQMDVPDLFDQFGLAKCTTEHLKVEPLTSKDGSRRLVDVLQQENVNLVLGIGSCLCHSGRHARTRGDRGKGRANKR